MSAIAGGGSGAVVRRAEAPPWVIDSLFAVAVASTIALMIATEQASGGSPDLVAYLFAAGFGGLMFLRRSAPRLVLALTVPGMFVYYALDYPPIGLAVPVFAALLSAAERGAMVWSIGSGLIAYVVSMHYRIRDGHTPAFLLGYESVSNVALIAAAIALGYGLRARKVQAAQEREINRMVAIQAARDADLTVRRERERISRDLHDSIGHTMSVIALQAGVAAEAVGPDRPVAVAALDRIRTASSRSLNEVRAMVKILRAGDEGTAREVLSLSAVPGLVEAARGAGIDVTVDVRVHPSDLATAVDAAGYRVIQEALTNVVRHSGARRASVSADLSDGVLRIAVADDGRGSIGAAADGSGLRGMMERVRLLGGEFDTRSRLGQGFRVHATIPAKAGE
jgi:signal transduction histidine kinase